MKLGTIRLSGFQSFGQESTELSLEDTTYLIGPNGSGKTAVLQALCRLFAFDPVLRRIQRSDFHVPFDENEAPQERQLWIEADFLFPELAVDEDNSTVAPYFGHMRLDEQEGIPRVRFRLTATMGPDGDIEETLVYVLDINTDGSPQSSARVPRAERHNIQVHYLPARRDPADHIAYGANALLGRLLRAVRWDDERDTIKGLTDQISDSLAENPSVNAFSERLKMTWATLHKGKFFADPKITFVASEIEALLRHLSVSFTPSHDGSLVDFSRLSDGQKSMLYLSLVLSSQAIGRAVLAEEDVSFDPDKLRPPVFTLIALEEPENSLSPHYLGRIVSVLNTMAKNADAQALIATHAPTMLRRVAPELIRYLRLTEERKTRITCIKLPAKTDEAHKFVREAVQAFPEIYFSRLVVLGEGDSEEIVLPRLLQAKGAPVDESAVTIAPLGGRHVNHFWRLLSVLQIPYLTLLDLDVARYAAGWGRIKYVNDQFAVFEPRKLLPAEWVISRWNNDETPIRTHHFFNNAAQTELLDIFIELQDRGVFFSSPMDLDFSMLLAYPEAYGVVEEEPDESIIKAVLGKSYFDASQYSEEEKKLFVTYHKSFKLGSKPAAHIDALAKLNDAELLAEMPESLSSLADAVIAKLAELPE
ncbi:TPA: AAA family ATPase [Yersinia enterocolitica]|nr:AAA family ATPase [Yersinia enterocolitica]EKN4817747.1 AAA family ATPase [Yersinia enterocolitica]EKN4835042.1 AAA family ATPase [Yersinia enterocolitica]CNK67598.1 putative OLD family ATP-dependent endonuclease [Yersinia enterocolitica]HDL7338459.1 AAA family ATPase [Yersinia enterocolitica]